MTFYIEQFLTHMIGDQQWRIITWQWILGQKQENKKILIIKPSKICTHLKVGVGPRTHRGIHTLIE